MREKTWDLNMIETIMLFFLSFLFCFCFSYLHKSSMQSDKWNEKRKKRSKGNRKPEKEIVFLYFSFSNPLREVHNVSSKVALTFNEKYIT